jgi:hypothetical protein
MHDHVDHEVIRNEVAAIHIGLRGSAELGPVLAMFAQQIPTRHVRHAENVSQDACLRAFAGARRAKQQNDLIVPTQRHRCKPSQPSLA